MYWYIQYQKGLLRVLILLNTFYQNKKSLLIHEFIQKNGRWVGYIKVFPYLLFDVHMSSPKGSGLLAQLDRIQNAIQDKNPKNISDLIQGLSPEQQLFFMPVLNTAMDLLDFKTLLKEEI